MAKITLSLEELVEILISNEILPRNIARVQVSDNEIHFIINTPSFILPFIPATLRYLNFQNSNMVFELTLVNGQVNEIMHGFNQVFEPRMPAYMKYEYPNIFVDVDRLFHEKNIKGVKVEDVFFEKGEFTIVTGKN